LCVTVPDGVGPGDVLEIEAPTGQPMHVAVPDGLTPGDTFEVPPRRHRRHHQQHQWRLQLTGAGVFGWGWWYGCAG
jgi:hypothetical protein